MAGTPPRLRKQAYEDAGMSPDQYKTAMKLARIPQEDFEVMVEAYDAPTITFLSKPHVSHNAGENEWYTPPEYIEAARLVMGDIDLDPASSRLAQRTVKAAVYFTKSIPKSQPGPKSELRAATDPQLSRAHLTTTLRVLVAATPKKPPALPSSKSANGPSGYS